jgi:hypothetical protein
MALITKFVRNFSLNVITDIFSSDMKQGMFIGRWYVLNTNTNTNINANTNINNNIINSIIDRNNEDHCGGCISHDNKQEMFYLNKKNIEDNDEYYRAFFM